MRSACPVMMAVTGSLCGMGVGGWDPSRRGAAERSGAFRCTVPERNAIYEHAARQAATATEYIRRCAHDDPARAADAAWAAADTLHAAARALRSPALRRAADSYDRAARARYGQIPRATREGDQLRAAARLMALTGQITSDAPLVTLALIANLAALAAAVAELRQAQQHAAQAAAARAAASQLHAVCVRDRSGALRQGRAEGRQRSQPETAADVARGDFPVSLRPGRLAPVAPGRTRPPLGAAAVSLTSIQVQRPGPRRGAARARDATAGPPPVSAGNCRARWSHPAPPRHHQPRATPARRRHRPRRRAADHRRRGQPRAAT